MFRTQFTFDFSPISSLALLHRLYLRTSISDVFLDFSAPQIYIRILIYHFQFTRVDACDIGSQKRS
jgi:hypothetical protein